MRNTPDRLSRVPNQPKPPVHSLRVDDDIWHAAQAKAVAEGRTLTAVLVAYLKRYASTPARKRPDAADPADADS